MSKNNLYILGSINIDLSISCDKLPENGETINGKEFSVSLGGKGCNQGFYASELGINTYLFGAIGNDYYSQFALNKLNGTQLNLKISRKVECETGVAIIIKNNNDNRIILNNGANHKINLDDLEGLNDIKEGDFFLTQLENQFEIAFKALEIAFNKKAITFFNPAPATIIDKDIYRYVHFLILNETESQELTNMSCDDIYSYRKSAKYFLDKGVKNIIITLGSKGSFFMNKDWELFVPSLKINVSNTTGAGDSFIGAFISKYNETNSIEESLKFATIISAIVCENNEVQVENIYKKYELKINK